MQNTKSQDYLYHFVYTDFKIIVRQVFEPLFTGLSPVVIVYLNKTSKRTSGIVA